MALSPPKSLRSHFRIDGINAAINGGKHTATLERSESAVCLKSALKGFVIFNKYLFHYKEFFFYILHIAHVFSPTFHQYYLDVFQFLLSHFLVFT